MSQNIFAIPGDPSVIDYALHTGFGAYTGQTLEQLQERYPGTILTTEDAHRESYESVYLAEQPKRITDGDFQRALECLPPQNWRSGNFAESFEMVERITGRITRAYVRFRCGEAYSFPVIAGTSHADKLARMPHKCSVGRG